PLYTRLFTLRHSTLSVFTHPHPPSPPPTPSPSTPLFRSSAYTALLFAISVQSHTRHTHCIRNGIVAFPFARHTHSALERLETLRDRKSTRLNSSHVSISYAVFCLQKKTQWRHDAAGG